MKWMLYTVWMNQIPYKKSILIYNKKKLETNNNITTLQTRTQNTKVYHIMGIYCYGKCGRTYKGSISYIYRRILWKCRNKGPGDLKMCRFCHLQKCKWSLANKCYNSGYPFHVKGTKQYQHAKLVYQSTNLNTSIKDYPFFFIHIKRRKDWSIKVKWTCPIRKGSTTWRKNAKNIITLNNESID